MKYLIAFTIILLSAKLSFAQQLFFVGFGEIPALSKSSKPSIGFGYRKDLLEFGLIHQFEDRLQRDEESYNADFGMNGLESAREETGTRSMFQVKLFPNTEWFYFTLAAIESGGDLERIIFKEMSRQIGDNTYQTDVKVSIKRSGALSPAIGAGFKLPITKSMLLKIDITMDWFNEVPIPEITIDSGTPLLKADKEALSNQILENYLANFHNRYHAFNIGVQFIF